MEEIEVKFLNINKDLLEQKLISCGAKKQGEYFYRRSVFDYPDLSLDGVGAWVRLRDEGDKIMLSFKQRLGMQGNSGNDEGMYEREVEVKDFTATADILRKLASLINFILKTEEQDMF